MNRRIWRLVWIVVVVVLFATSLESRKPRNSHPHGHHHKKSHARVHHRHHHRHRRHALLPKNFFHSENKSSEISNITKIDTPIFDVTSPPTNFNYSEAVKKFSEFSTIGKIEFNPFENSTIVPAIFNNLEKERTTSFKIFNTTVLPGSESTQSNSIFRFFSGMDNVTTDKSLTNWQSKETHFIFTNQMPEEREANVSFIENITESSTTNFSKSLNFERSENVSDGLKIETNRRGAISDLGKLFGSTEETIGSTESPTIMTFARNRPMEIEEEPNKRSLLDFNGPAISDLEDFEDFEASNIPHKRVKRDREFDQNLDPNYLHDLENSFAPSALEMQAENSGINGISRQLRSSDFSRPKREGKDQGSEENLEDPNLENSSKNNETIQKVESSENLTLKNDFTPASEANELGKSSGNISETRLKKSEDGNYLQDENRSLRNKLDDVYPDSLEDPERRSPLVQLIRTKRFDDFGYPEISNEERSMEDPYAEDNGIIDSMLNKVEEGVGNDKSVYARRDLENSYNFLNNDPEERSDLAGKNPHFYSRDKKKSDYSRLKRWRKKPRRFRNKKRRKFRRRRPKGRRFKRAPSFLDFAGRNAAPKTKRETGDENYARDRYSVIYGPDSESGLRRSEGEDESDGAQFYANELAARQIRESEANNFINSEKDSREDAKNRGKRDTDHEVAVNSSNENQESNVTSKVPDKESIVDNAAKPINDIKQMVEKLLNKVNELHGYINEDSKDHKSSSNSNIANPSSEKNRDKVEVPKNVQQASAPEQTISKSGNSMKRQQPCWKSSVVHERPLPTTKRRPVRKYPACGRRIRRKRKSHRKWDRWTNWSSCSVTCGRGREIRWRQCLRNCSTAETEMEEKACQLPACPPGKFLGIFG